MQAKNLRRHDIVSLLLRVGLAFVFLYAAISAFAMPEAWIGFIPEFATDIVPVSSQLLLNAFSLFEIFLAIWLLSGMYIRYAAIVSAILLSGLILFNLNAFLITFRDVALVLASIALVFLDEPQKVTKKR